MGVSSLGWRGPGASEQPVRHKMQTSLPQAHPQPFTPSRLDQTLPLTLSNPAGPSLPFGVRTNNLGRNRGGGCLLRSWVGPGPQSGHHRRLKTKLTVRMMPRRRTKGSQVFTKAPTLWRERRAWAARAWGVSVQLRTSSTCTPRRGCSPQEAPGPTLSVLNSVN